MPPRAFGSAARPFFSRKGAQACNLVHAMHPSSIHCVVFAYITHTCIIKDVSVPANVERKKCACKEPSHTQCKFRAARFPSPPRLPASSMPTGNKKRSVYYTATASKAAAGAVALRCCGVVAAVTFYTACGSTHVDSPVTALCQYWRPLPGSVASIQSPFFVSEPVRAAGCAVATCSHHHQETTTVSAKHYAM